MDMNLQEARQYFKIGDLTKVAKIYGYSHTLVHMVSIGKVKNKSIEEALIELGKNRKIEHEKNKQKVLKIVQG